MPNRPRRIWLPQSVEEAWHIRRELGPAGAFAGGATWLQAQWEAGRPSPDDLVSLEGLREGRGIHMAPDDPAGLEIQALTPLSDCAADSLLADRCPALAGACRKIGGPAVRTRATLGGNAASGTGDLLPLLLVMNASAATYDGGRTLAPVEEWDAEAGRILLSIRIPAQSRSFRTHYDKVGRRKSFAPSVVVAASQILIGSDGSIEAVRMAVGGGGRETARLIGCERRLVGQRPEPGLWREAHDWIRSEYKGFSDAFASAEYRAYTAANLLVARLSGTVPAQAGAEKGV